MRESKAEVAEKAPDRVRPKKVKVRQAIEDDPLLHAAGDETRGYILRIAVARHWSAQLICDAIRSGFTKAEIEGAESAAELRRRVGWRHSKHLESISRDYSEALEQRRQHRPR